MTAAISTTIADVKLDIHPCLLVAPDDRFNPPRCVQRIKTAVCLNTRNTITPTKNDSSAISTHADRINAKDTRSIGVTSLLVEGTDRLERMSEDTAMKPSEVVREYSRQKYSFSA